MGSMLPYIAAPWILWVRTWDFPMPGLITIEAIVNWVHWSVQMYCTSMFFSDSWCTGLPGTYVGFPPWDIHNSWNSELIEVRITTITMTCAWSFDDCYCIYIYIAWLVVWNMIFIFPFSWECHHPNWRSHVFQRGGSITNQLLWLLVKTCFTSSFFWFDSHVSWFICLKSPCTLRSFNALYRRVITSQDFHDMRKNNSLWDLTCKIMQTNERTSQYISKYLKKTQSKLKMSQTISENLEGLSDKKRNNHFGTPTNLKILQNISKNPKHAKTCKNMQIHALICKQNSGQRGYDCECCRKVMKIFGASPVCCQQHVCGEPKKKFIINKIYI